ncbi:hypothetical protein [Sphingobium sp. MK2]|uniref:hypothetical protein n=1 Tax=Sphingobium sp. MK2 TaxID=3116540 RepID=UPI0032E35E0D
MRDDHAAGWFHERWSASTVARTASRSDRLQNLFVRFMMHFSDKFWVGQEGDCRILERGNIKDPLEILVTPLETGRMDCSAYISPGDAKRDA